ncbi:MAG: Tol-Pal system beta propeller repeat protein TolB [Holosporales bacterium]
MLRQAITLITRLVIPAFLVAPVARAALEVEITQGTFQPIPIAITDLTGSSGVAADIGRQISMVVAADLESSGLFKPIDPRSFIQDAQSLQQGPRFGDWRVINAQALVKGDVSDAGGGQYRIEFRLYDVLNEQQVEGLAFTVSTQDLRRSAHKIADAIYKRLTGEDGYFDTRIAYVSQTGSQIKPIKRIAIMDRDGANHRYLTAGQNFVQTPSFSPDAQRLIYLEQAGSGAGRKFKLHFMDLNSGQKIMLGQMAGQVSSARFTPDGRRVIFSAEYGDGMTSLYAIDLASRQQTRLTQGPHIDSSPSVSPDGSKVIFVSDRGGKPQLYVMGSSGGSAERISFGEGIYLMVSWSPRGDMVAFVKLHKGSFYLGVMREDGSGERLLATGGVIDMPSWSPNGRVVLFSRQDNQGRKRLYTVDLTGHNERLLETPTDAESGSWSPLLP